MNVLLYNEKRIIFQILYLIMEADLIEHPAEIHYLNKVFNEFELNINEFDHMEMIDFDNLLKEFKKFPDETKLIAKHFFLEMAKCDGYVDPREMSIIDSIFNT